MERQKIQTREKNERIIQKKEGSKKETNKRAKQTREACPSEILTFMCQSAWCHIPEDRSLRGK